MKILSVVGARPQFIKAAPVSHALRDAGIEEYLVHTGQHYDFSMSGIFFDEMDLPQPDVNLSVGSGSHGWQTGMMLIGIEAELIMERPDCVVVYGDTNSTLAGAIAACKIGIPLAHVEAGLRSYNREMPEEYNRILADHCADILFCPTETARAHLEGEGITEGVHVVGDTMYDAVLEFSGKESRDAEVLERYGLTRGGYLLATVHRPYNTDVKGNLESILRAFIEVSEPVLFPVHPRTRKKMDELDSALRGALARSMVILTEPVSYREMLMLEQNARMVLTDSGGMQKEAYFFGVPCITLRPETEWVETVAAGWNVVVGADRERIVHAVKEGKRPGSPPPPVYGDGKAGQRIAGILSLTGELGKHDKNSAMN